MTTPTLLRAAELLEEYAHGLFVAHTIDGRWPDNDEVDRRARDNHAELIDVASELRVEYALSLRAAQNMSQIQNSGDGTYRP